MKYKLKLYLDTSVISALFDERNPERKSLTEEFFGKINQYEIFVSQFTIAEINNTPDENLKNKMITIIDEFESFHVSEDTERFVKSLIHLGAISEKVTEDAYHIAIAMENDVDFLLSWNFRHIVRQKTRDIVRMICTTNGLRYIDIITPAELL